MPRLLKNPTREFNACIGAEGFEFAAQGRTKSSQGLAKP